MALIKCKECGKEISNKASVCPNCGCPIEKEKVKIRIYTEQNFIAKCSVSIDNLAVGQLGGIMLGKQKDIELSLPIGTHYISVVTQIEHSGALTGVVGVGQEQDGKQFEITNDDKYIEIEVVSKGSFTGTSGKYCIGNIKHYDNLEELEQISKALEEELKKKEEEKELMVERINIRIEKTTNFFKKNIAMFIILFILIIVVIVIINILKYNRTIKDAEGTYYGMICMSHRNDGNTYETVDGCYGFPHSAEIILKGNKNCSFKMSEETTSNKYLFTKAQANDMVGKTLNMVNKECSYDVNGYNGDLTITIDNETLHCDKLYGGNIGYTTDKMPKNISLEIRKSK